METIAQTQGADLSEGDVYRHPVLDGHRRMLLDRLGKCLGGNRRYAVVDFPDYSNVGDSAIWLGQMTLLREATGADPVYVSKTTPEQRDDLPQAGRQETVFITGGGNFGDLWPKHQQLRLRLLRTLKGTRIVQLPQSIKFEGGPLLEQTRQAIAEHGDFHLLVRDEQSVRFAREHFDCEVDLMPDAAMGLYPLKRRVSPVRDLLLLLRTDKERVAIDDALFDSLGDALRCDWLEESRDDIVRTRRIARLRALTALRISEPARRFDVFTALAHLRLNRGLDLLQSSRRIITDRLHVHILGTLSGIPHVALDNSYRKIHNYMDCWTGGVDVVHGAEGAAQAAEILRRIRSA